MRSRLVKRASSAVAVLVVATAALVGCSGSEGSQSKSVDLQTWAGNTADQGRWNTLAAQSLSKAGVTVNVHFSTFDAYNEKIGTLLATGQAGCIVRMQAPRLAGFTGSLLPLDNMVKSSGLDTSQFQKTAMDGMKVDGVQYGIPTDLGPAVLYYNPESFKAAGVPDPAPGWTTQDFLKAAKALTGAGKYGLAVTGEDIEMLSWALNTTGGTPVSSDGSWQLTSPAFVEGVQNWANLMVQDGVAKAVSGSATAATAEAQQEFSDGTAAMMIGGPWDFEAVKGKTKFTPQVAQLPGGSKGSLTYTNGSGFAIAKTCPDPQSAFDAIKVAVGEGFQKVMGDFGAFPALTSAQSSWFTGTASGLDKSVFSKAFGTARTMPQPAKKNWNVADQLLSQYVAQIANQPGAARGALSTIQNQVG